MSAPVNPADVLGATESALAALDLEDEDQAAAALALRLASALDFEESGRTTAELAGKLLATLESLGATPAARKAVLPKGGAPGDSPARTARDDLRARRAARAHGAADLDAAAP
ncbi:terminase small subunit [Amycolatopsis echigonensis]|uniref:Terminase small subunit actinomycetes phage-type domain-containing protein n=1 Tax=Amycolatopsis echigonensis TaxID=2576905 RepID=A0A8E2B6I7_9PSEU|nr:hypothetical protein [Amycolatopsis echigonensis]MBB2502936.1 hypothetical protein [Amycolatopsis echigonensis]